jgi:hypothetical protein
MHETAPQTILTSLRQVMDSECKIQYWSGLAPHIIKALEANGYKIVEEWEVSRHVSAPCETSWQE